MNHKKYYFQLLIIALFHVNLFAQELELAPPPVPETAKSSDLRSKAESMKVYRGKESGKYGFYNSREILIPFMYDKLPEKYSDYMVAKKGDKYGMINKKGVEVLPFQYDYLFERNLDNKKVTENKYIIAKKKNFKGVFNQKGKLLIPLIYTNLVDLKDGYFAVGSEEKKNGILDIKGNVVVPMIYDRAIGKGIGNYLITTKNGKYGGINRMGKILIPFEYDRIEQSLYKGYISLSKGGKKGLMQKNGEIVVPVIYDYIRQRPDGTIEARKDGKMGVLSSEFDILIPFIYHIVKRKSAYYYEFKIENIPKSGVLDTLGNTILPPDFVDIIFSRNELIAARKIDGIFAIFDSSGKEIAPPIFRRVKFERDYAIVNKKPEGKKAIMNNRGELLTEFIYDYVTSRKNKEKRKSFDIIVIIDGKKQIWNP